MIIEKTDFLTADMMDLLTDLVLDVYETDGVRYNVPEDASLYVLLYEEHVHKDHTADKKETRPAKENQSNPAGAREGNMAETTDPLPDELVSVLALYEMGETYQGKTVMEIVAFTGPKHRKKGYFKLLFESVKKELGGYSVRFAVYEDILTGNIAGAAVKAALRSAGTKHDHDELLMKFLLNMPQESRRDASGTADVAVDIRENTKASLDTAKDWPDDPNDAAVDEARSKKSDFAIQKNEDNDGDWFHVTTHYGECYYRIYDDGTAYIYGILTLGRFQKRGHALKMLKNLLSFLEEEGLKQAVLEVSSANIAALNLYKKLGFEVTERLGYYIIPAQDR